MRCPNCQRESDEDGGFCEFCGSHLPPTDLERFCSECGAERQAGSAFCPNCGAAFSAAPAPLPRDERRLVAAPPAKPADGLKIAIGVAAACLVLLLGVGGAWFIFNQDKLSGASPASMEARREQAFRHFTQGMELMEGIEKGKGDGNTLAQALEHAEQATRLDPSAAAYWHLLGYVYSHLQEDQLASVLAEDALNQSIKLNPANVSSRLLLARLLLGRESYSLALDQLEWVIRKEARTLNAVLAADLCRAYVVDEQATRGEAFFREMRQRRPELSALRLGHAILLHEAGRRQVALVELRELLADSRAAADDLAYARQLEQAWRGEPS